MDLLSCSRERIPDRLQKYRPFLQLNHGEEQQNPQGNKGLNQGEEVDRRAQTPEENMSVAAKQHETWFSADAISTSRDFSSHSCSSLRPTAIRQQWRIQKSLIFSNSSVQKTTDHTIGSSGLNGL
jgi:hypothetical protein